MQLRTPTPPAALINTLWEARTPSNIRELEAQSTLIRERVRKHKSSSPASIIEAIDQLKKGAEVMMLSAELMRDRITSLEKANKAASERKQRKKKRIQKQGVLTKGAGEDIITQREAEQQITREERQRGEQLGVSRQSLARCKRCRERGHNLRTCKKEPIANVPHGRAAHTGEPRTFAKTTPKSTLLWPVTAHFSPAQDRTTCDITQRPLLLYSYTFAHCARPRRTVYSVVGMACLLQRVPSSSASSYHCAPQTHSELLIAGPLLLLGSLLSESAFFCVIFGVKQPHLLLEARRSPVAPTQACAQLLLPPLRPSQTPQL